jgi:hypothetical protein
MAARELRRLVVECHGGNVVEQDREGAGASVAVPFGGEEATCPVGGLRRWLDGAAVSEGRVFRRIDRHGNPGPALSDRALADIVTARAAAAGFEGDFAATHLRGRCSKSSKVAIDTCPGCRERSREVGHAAQGSGLPAKPAEGTTTFIFFNGTDLWKR